MKMRQPYHDFRNYRFGFWTYGVRGNGPLQLFTLYRLNERNGKHVFSINCPGWIERLLPRAGESTTMDSGITYVGDHRTKEEEARRLEVKSWVDERVRQGRNCYSNDSA